MPRDSLFLSDRYPVLRELLTEAAPTLVDVGGRGEAFTPLRPLAPFSRYVVSEPDEVEARRLAEALPQAWPWRGVEVITEAIASTRGPVTLRITATPGMSSLLEPDPAVTGRFYLGHKFAVRSEITVPAIPLDDAAAQHGFEDAVFLKLDTQGTELDILQSGERLLNSVLGVSVETNFHAFYKGQSLFADVDAYLRARGFSLFTLTRTQLRRANPETQLYSARMDAWAHCLYLREPEACAATGETARRRTLTALLALACVFHQFDFGATVLAQLQASAGLAEAQATALGREYGEIRRYFTRRALRLAADEGRDATSVTALSAHDTDQTD